MAVGPIRRFAAPAALFAGLVLFGISLLVLGTAATPRGSDRLDPSALTVENQTAVLSYTVEFYGRVDRVDADFAFPQAVGDAFFVGCDDLARLESGRDPVAPALVFEQLRDGHIVVSDQTVANTRGLYTNLDARGYASYCAPSLAFRWIASDNDTTANRPSVTVTAVSRGLPSEGAVALMVLSTGGALLALVGGLAWARVRAGGEDTPSADDSTVEALRRSLDRMGEQLERTRRHLLFAGVLGVFLWYPILVPWTWRQAAAATPDPLVPWAVAAATLAFLVVLTVLWAREFVRLDREVRAWRARMDELRARETGLMSTLDQGG
jgi:hypothetical protein